MAGGKLRYFGSMRNDPTGAESWARYNRELEDWKAGRNPRAVPQPRPCGTVSAREIADRWLQYRASQIGHSDPDVAIGQRAYDDSIYAVEAFGLAFRESGLDPSADPLAWGPLNWQQIRAKLGEIRLAGTRRGVAPPTKGGRIVAIRMMFKWACNIAEIVPRLPRWADCFGTVSEKTKQNYRYDFQREHGERAFDLERARRLLDAADNAVARAGLNANNTTGFRGVSQRKEDGKYEAYIVLKRDGKRV